MIGALLGALLAGIGYALWTFHVGPEVRLYLDVRATGWRAYREVADLTERWIVETASGELYFRKGFRWVRASDGKQLEYFDGEVLDGRVRSAEFFGRLNREA